MFTWLSGKETLAERSGSLSIEECNDLLDDAEFERDRSGARLFVAPLPANKLLSKDGLLAQTKA